MSFFSVVEIRSCLYVSLNLGIRKFAISAFARWWNVGILESSSIDTVLVVLAWVLPLVGIAVANLIALVLVSGYVILLSLVIMLLSVVYTALMAVSRVGDVRGEFFI